MYLSVSENNYTNTNTGSYVFSIRSFSKSMSKSGGPVTCPVKRWRGMAEGDKQVKNKKHSRFFIAL